MWLNKFSVEISSVLSNKGNQSVDRYTHPCVIVWMWLKLNVRSRLSSFDNFIFKIFYSELNEFPDKEAYVLASVQFLTFVCVNLLRINLLLLT